MAFDWTKLTGYREDMTPEEKVALMENYTEPEAPRVDTSKLIGKDQFDKVASELAETKRKLRARQSEDEQAEEDRKAREVEKDQLINSLLKEKKFATTKSHYLALGYTDEMATKATEAKLDDDDDALFAIMAQHSSLKEKALKAEFLKQTPTPPAGEGEDPEYKKALAEYNRQRKYAGLAPVTKLP